MGLSLLDLPRPIKIVPAAPLSDEEFLAFCRANEPYQFEQDAKGEIIVMTPSGGEGGNLEGFIFRELDLWVERSGLGYAFNSTVCFRLPDKSFADAGRRMGDIRSMEFPDEEPTAKISAVLSRLCRGASLAQ